MIVLLNDEADAFWCFERLMRRLVKTSSPSSCPMLFPVTSFFWTFNHHLSKIFKRGNFRCTQQSVGVENQLQHLASIIQVLDPKLHGHLGMEQRLVRAVTVRHSILCQHLLLLHPAIGSCWLLNTETLGGGDYLFAFRMFMVLFRRELSFGDSLYLWEVKCYILTCDFESGTKIRWLPTYFCQEKETKIEDLWSPLCSMVLDYIRHLQMWLVYDWLQPCHNLSYLLERLVALQAMHSYGSVHIIKYSQYILIFSQIELNSTVPHQRKWSKTLIIVKNCIYEIFPPMIYEG
jgi:hypothetical protein